jgi:hypothetical protein
MLKEFDWNITIKNKPKMINISQKKFIEFTMNALDIVSQFSNTFRINVEDLKLKNKEYL